MLNPKQKGIVYLKSIPLRGFSFFNILDKIQIMKQIVFVLYVLFSVGSFAQVPSNYYNSATGTGYVLKTQLYNIIKDHDSQSYSSLWTLYNDNAYKDFYYENDGTLLDVYSEKPNGADSYTYTIGSSDQCGNYSGEGDCYNREHIIPQSVFDEASPMRTDGHHVIPTDGYVNGMRGNHPIGKVNVADWTSTNGSKRGSSAVSGYTGTVFEPIDEFKGDIARIYFYFATRYENKVSNWNYAMFNGTSNQVFTDGFLDMLLEWHENDPVSEREIAINNRVYQFQGNRNPFIDNPQYVHDIWGYSSASVNDFSPVYVSVYPNPSKDNKINISSDKEIEEITLINLNGQIIQQVKKPTTQGNIYTLDNLPQGFYILNLNIENQSVTKKVIVN